jgi:hypothetical protein
MLLDGVVGVAAVHQERGVRCCKKRERERADVPCIDMGRRENLLLLLAFNAMEKCMRVHVSAGNRAGETWMCGSNSLQT